MESDEWERLGIDSTQIAQAFYNATSGDRRKLLSRDIEKDDAIWGSIAAQLIKTRTPTQRDRVILYMIWSENRKSVEVEFNKLAGKRTRTKKGTVPIVYDKTLCICEKTQRKLPRAKRIRCTQCGRDLHYACAGISASGDPNPETFICGYCRGDLLVPPMLDETVDDGNQHAFTKHVFDDDYDDEDDVNKGSYFYYSENELLDDSESSLSGAEADTKDVKNTKATSVTSNKASSCANVTTGSPSILSSKWRQEDLSSDHSGDGSTSEISSPVKGVTKGENKIDFNQPSGEPKQTDSWSFLKSGKHDDKLRRRHVSASSMHPTFSEEKGLTDVSDDEIQSQKSSKEFTVDADNTDYEDEEFRKDTDVSPINQTNKTAKSSPSPTKDERHTSPEGYKLNTENNEYNLESSKEEIKANVPGTSGGALDLKKRFISKLQRFHTYKTTKSKETVGKAVNASLFGASEQENKDVKPPPKKPINPSVVGKLIKNKHFDKGEKLDTSEVAKNVEIKTSYDEWRKIVILKPNAVGDRAEDFEFKRDYYVHLRRLFKPFNKFCVLTFKEKIINNPYPVTGNFVRVRTQCKRYPCTAKWTFYVAKKPKENADVVIEATLTGELDHYENCPGTVRWKGVQQEEGQESVTTTLPATVRLLTYDKADASLMEAGNFMEVPSLKAYQRMRDKKQSAEDKHSDVIRDIALTDLALHEKFPDDDIPGYAQTQSTKPAKFILYTRKQMDILYELQRQKKGVFLLMDATGCLLRPLPYPFDDRTLLLYTVVIRSTEYNINMPLTEMITADNTNESVYHWLNQFFRSNYTITAPFFGVTKLEVDFSKSMIIAALKVFTGQTVEDYITSLWNAMVKESNTEKIFPLHICRFHVLRAIEDKFKTVYLKQGKKIEFETMVLWSQKLVLSSDLLHFQRRLKDIGIICGFEYQTPSVLSRIEGLRRPTEKEVPLWSKIQPNTSKNLPFWSRSPFGNFCDFIFTRCEKKNADIISGPKREENSYYSPYLLNYIKVYIAPYLPMVTHGVFSACNIPVKDDTTNAIEQYHCLLKQNIYKLRAKQKVPRFIRRQAEVLNGFCKIANSKLGIKESLPKKKPEKEKEDSAPNDNPEVTYEEDLEPDWESEDDYVPSATPKDMPLPVSPDKEKEKFKTTKIERSYSAVQGFMDVIPLIPWGQRYIDDNRRILLQNTCPIDTGLQILTGLYVHFQPFTHFLESKKLSDPLVAAVDRMLKQLSKGNFDEGKSIWIREVMKFDLKSVPAGESLNLRSSERASGFGLLADWIKISWRFLCGNKECEQFVDLESKKTKLSDWNRVEVVNISNVTNAVPEPEMVLKLLNETTSSMQHCRLCKMRGNQTYKIFSTPYFIFYPLEYQYNKIFPERKLELLQVIQGRRFKVFAYTAIRGTLTQEDLVEVLPHFISVFVVENKRVVFDGLKKKPYIQRNYADEGGVTSVWLIPE